MDGCIAKVTIDNQRDAAAGILESFLAEVIRCGYADQACFGIRLALDEAFANAIQHGNANDPQKSIEIYYSVDGDEARISIADQGPGFAPDNLPDPTALENLEKPTGRGVMLMQAYMTEVSFNDCGNCVTLIKRRSCTLPM